MMPDMAPAADGDAWSLEGGVRHITQLQLDRRFGLLLDDNLVVIGVPFVMQLDGASFEVDPAAGVGVARAVGVLHRRVDGGRASRAGDLDLVFEGGRLHVAPHAEFESWEVVLSDGAIWVALPGGGVSSFPPRR